VNEALLEPFRHNAWATRELIGICRTLPPEHLEATAPGTYGGVHRTLHHIVAAEDYYRSLLTGLERRWRSIDPAPPLDELARRAEELGAFWDRLLAEPFDPERVLVDEDAKGRQEIRAGVLLAQALTHGTDHRTQVLTILTMLGVEHPGLDAWDYGRATGRVVKVSPPRETPSAGPTEGGPRW
jgi:uncharacterized damage-inducible protein DinB